METMQRVEKVRGLYNDLLLLSKEQLQLAQEITADRDTSQEILILFQKRQEMMEEIELLLLKINHKEDNKGNINDGWNSRVKLPLSLGEQQAGAGDKALRDIMAIIRDIHAHDEVGRKIIEKARQETGKKLAGLKRNRAASNAYLNMDSAEEAWFFDQKR